MATFICLINFTDQGIRNVKDSPKRFEVATKLAKSFGVKVKQGFYTMGQYDIVIIAEGTDEAAAAWLFKAGSLGNVKTTTLRAFTVDETREILGKI
jgi:uncharacterized protein with GYD domain